MPGMSTSDPIVKYNEWKPGTTVRIIRYEDSLKTASKVSVYYRVIYGK